MADITMKMPPPPPRNVTPTLHPAAAEAAAAYSDALLTASKMEVELRELRVSYDAASRHIDMLEKKLAACEYNRQALERYAVEVTTHLDGIAASINVAKAKSLQFAKTPPQEPEPPRVVIEDMERAIADAAIELRKDP